MAIKVDRPMDSFGEGIVVYVAKSKAEVDQVRDGFAAAGVPVELPEAAVEAMFAAGRESLSIRVAPEHFRAATDVIDELFPPPEVELPPLPEEQAAGDGGASSDGGAGSSSAARAGPVLDDVSEPLDGPRVRKKTSLAKLKTSALKVMFIAAAGVILPGFGIALAGFALVSAIWLLRALDRVQGGETGRPRAIAAIVVSSLALVWGIGVVAYLVWMR